MSEDFNINKIELEILLHKFFTDSLTDEEADELLGKLEGHDKSDDFRRTLSDSLWMHSLLGYHYHSEKQQFPNDVFEDESYDSDIELPSNYTVPTAGEWDELVRMEAGSETVTPSPKPISILQKTDIPEKITLKKGREEPAPERFSPFTKFAIAISLIVILVMVFNEFKAVLRIGEGEGEAFLGQITLVADPVFPEDAEIFKLDQKIGAETIVLESGMIELLLQNNVRIVLEGPCVFDLRSKMQAFCQIGKASLEVPENAIGYEVLTPFMNIRDLGTEFVVDVSESGSSVHVVKGKVTATPLSGNWTEVASNLCVRSAPGNSLVQAPLEKDLYITKTRITEAAEKYEKNCLIDWNSRREKLALEPELLFQLDFLDSPEEKYGLDLGKGGHTILGCRKVPGRWNGKNAVRFTKASDAIRVSAPAKRKSFTMFASVKLKDLSHTSNVIFSHGNLEKGALHWQINKAGEIQFLIGGEEKESLDNFASPGLIDNKQTGVWLYLASTIDEEKGIITHYLDGKPVAVLPWNRSLEFDFSIAEIGNWRRSGTSPSKRHFNGEIDEFILLGRVADPEEISFYTNLIQKKEN